MYTYRKTAQKNQPPRGVYNLSSLEMLRINTGRSLITLSHETLSIQLRLHLTRIQDTGITIMNTTGPAGKIIRMSTPAHGVLNVSVRLLTKTFNCPWCQDHGISFERFPRRWQSVGPISGPSRVADSSLAFFKRWWGPFPELRRLWFACTGTSDEQTRPGSEPQSSAHGINPRVPLGLESPLGPFRHSSVDH